MHLLNVQTGCAAGLCRRERLRHLCGPEEGSTGVSPYVLGLVPVPVPVPVQAGTAETEQVAPQRNARYGDTVQNQTFKARLVIPKM